MMGVVLVLKGWYGTIEADTTDDISGEAPGPAGQSVPTMTRSESLSLFASNQPVTPNIRKTRDLKT
jgi:hypothetical protein